MAPITSTGNATVKAIRKLRSRREREATGTYWIEGIRIVAEAVETGASIQTLVVAPELLTSPYACQLVDSVRGRAPILEVSAEVFRSLYTREHPQGLGAVVRERWLRIEEADPSAGLCWVALEEVADPGNLGTILRTTDAVGAGGVILVGPSTDPYDPAALRASMGGVYTQPLVRASLDDLAVWKERHGAMVVGASGDAEEEYREVEYRRPLVLFMGGEREGLSDAALALCDLTVRIPMVGRMDSLNLAVATGVILYEVFARFY